MSTRPSSRVLPAVAALQESQLLAVADEEVGDAAQQRGALGDRGAGPLPRVEGVAGGGDGRVRVPLVTLRDHGERLGIRGIEDLAGGTGDGLPPLSPT